MKDAIAVVPLVPRRVPQSLNERGYPAVGAEIPVLQETPLIEKLSGTPASGARGSPREHCPSPGSSVLPMLVEGEDWR